MWQVRPPPPLTILQKLLMRERIDINTWNLVCDTTEPPQIQPFPPAPPQPYQFLQKLLMREQIDIKTWIWYVTPQCHLKLRIKPTPPVNFAKIPHERMDWHKDLKFGMWHHKNIFSLSFQKWSLWGGSQKKP